MLVFLVPLKSRTASKSWARVCSLLERTLRSICAQSVNDFRVIVVCNERPDIEFCHPSIEYILVDILPIESTCDWIHRGREDDKARRIKQGMVKAREYQPSFVMVVDADDCVSNELASYVQSQQGGRGWYLSQGYVHQQGKKWMWRKREHFQKVCGSSLILKPDDVEKVIIHDEQGYFFRHTLHPSDTIPLDPIPFPGAIYSVENGENHHMNSNRKSALRAGEPGKRINTFIRRLKNFRIVRITDSLRKQFGFYAM